MTSYIPRLCHSHCDAQYAVALAQQSHSRVLVEFMTMLGFYHGDVVACGPVTESLPHLFAAVARANQRASDLAAQANHMRRWKYKLIVWRGCWALRVSSVAHKRYRSASAGVGPARFSASRTVYAGVRGLFYDLIRRSLEPQNLVAEQIFPPVNPLVAFPVQRDSPHPVKTLQYLGSFPKPHTTKRSPDLPDAPHKGGKAARKMSRRNKRQGEKA